MDFLSFAFVSPESSSLLFCVPTMDVMVRWGSIILVPFQGQERKQGWSCMSPGALWIWKTVGVSFREF